MDPLGTLIVTLGTLVVLDLAALQLGGYRRPRARARGPALTNLEVTTEYSTPRIGSPTSSPFLGSQKRRRLLHRCRLSLCLRSSAVAGLTPRR